MNINRSRVKYKPSLGQLLESFYNYALWIESFCPWCQFALPHRWACQQRSADEYRALSNRAYAGEARDVMDSM